MKIRMDIGMEFTICRNFRMKERFKTPYEFQLFSRKSTRNLSENRKNLFDYIQIEVF